ncbi:PP2C family protein-serine/threonine phosphatase [Halodesulfovibrio marinisediminis]|uniref:Sigma-B regulation protein RsbU (Phosphoserine phosphatase) n=1 Tax=Halodesulfovibrio marinisediminis DSM 17456 TaxID=1121457 RepID=A0A1N6ITI5_9BACT|nr:SpoIIE family protein phosphatase [Halodesulfovibrio marinisediminis]SIO35316.1 sigma-B regulation protein RsbU (phosphoserine phosphatase) [Halodesulfovibrio marinisediminis DSM 17456]
MRAFLLYLTALILIYIYNGRICPFVSNLPSWQIGLLVLVVLGGAYLVRTLCYITVVFKQRLDVQAKMVGWMDFALFFAAGLSMVGFYSIVHGFPLIESGSKVLMGTLAIGFFVSIDLALEHSRKVMQMARRMEWTYALPQYYYPITTKFFLFGTITVLLFASLVVAVVTRDLYLLSEMEGHVSRAHIVLARKSILIDIIFIMMVLIGFTLNLLYSYSLNLRMLFESQTGILERVSKGDMDDFVPVMSSDEFGIIAGHTNSMITGLRDRIRMMEGLKVASEMQQALFPKKRTDFAGVDIAATSLFSDETGGDFFDFLENLGPEKNEMVVVLGDVTGHGIGAALLMASTRAYLRMQAEYQYSPGVLLSNTNRLLAYDSYGTGRFVTLFCLHISGGDNLIKWASAGHDPAIIFNGETSEFRDLKARGLPLGVMPETEYEEVCCDALCSGEVMLIGTDGIWEAMDANGQMYGKDRLKEVIRKNYDKTSAEILHAVAEAVRGFQNGEPQLDDITVVVLKAD